MAFVLLFYPGFMSTDSLVQLLQARNGELSDWHPPSMAVLWLWLEQLGLKGPAGMLVLQCGLFWAGLYLIDRAYLSDLPRSRWHLLLPLIGFFPPVFSIMGAIWKDVLLLGVLLVLIGGIGLYAKQRPTTLAYKVLVAGLLLGFAFFAVSLRHNAVFAVFPLLMPFFLRIREKRSLRAKSIAAGLAAFTTVFLFVASSWLSAQLSTHKTHVWALSVVFDTAGVIAQMDRRADQVALFEKVPEAFRNTDSVDRLLDQFTSHYALTPFQEPDGALRHPGATSPFDAYDLMTHGYRSLDADRRTALRELWLHLLKTHPREWIQHRLSVFADVLSASDHRPTAGAFFSVSEFPDHLKSRYETLENRDFHHVVLEINLWRLSQTGFYDPINYLVLSLALIGLIIAMGYRRFETMLFLVSSGVFYQFSLFLAAPAADYRYSHYMVTIAMLSTAILAIRVLSERARQKHRATPNGDMSPEVSRTYQG